MQISAVLYGIETEEFYTAIRALGYDESDFEIRPIHWPRTAKATAAIHDLVIVKRKCNGVEIAYPAVPNANGFITFVDDLYTGAFGMPAKLPTLYN
jgi:hypothetical protein